jgi:hypothetical protein
MIDYAESLRLRYRKQSTKQLLHIYASTDKMEVATSLLCSELRQRGIDDVDETVKPILSELAQFRERVDKNEPHSLDVVDLTDTYVYFSFAVFIAGFSLYELLTGDTPKAILIALVLGPLGILIMWIRNMLRKFLLWMAPRKKPGTGG